MEVLGTHLRGLPGVVLFIKHVILDDKTIIALSLRHLYHFFVAHRWMEASGILRLPVIILHHPVFSIQTVFQLVVVGSWAVLASVELVGVHVLLLLERVVFGILIRFSEIGMLFVLVHEMRGHLSLLVGHGMTGPFLIIDIIGHILLELGNRLSCPG